MNNKYEVNLKLYTLLKLLTQLKLTTKQLEALYVEVEDLNQPVKDEKWREDIVIKVLNVLSNEEIIGKSDAKKEKVSSISEIISTFKDSTLIFRLLYVAIALFIEKKKIIEIIDSTTNNKFIENENVDYLSLKYDTDTISDPYLRRALCPLVIGEYFNKTKTEISVRTKKCIDQVELLEIEYGVNSLAMFNLVIVESVNQGITSNAGSEYEKRIAKVLETRGYKYKKGQHDERQSSVEYDFIFNVNGYEIGLSAKRTLRERYKQNHRAVHELGVSKMLIVTLGTDLNEAKMDNILELQGQYILVAQEVYESKQYMQKCPRVFSSSNLDPLFSALGIKGY